MEAGIAYITELARWHERVIGEVERLMEAPLIRNENPTSYMVRMCSLTYIDTLMVIARCDARSQFEGANSQDMQDRQFSAAQLLRRHDQ